MAAPSFFETARKSIVAALGIGLLYGSQVFDVLGNSDLSTTDGIIAAVLALATVFGVYGVSNKTA